MLRRMSQVKRKVARMQQNNMLSGRNATTVPLDVGSTGPGGIVIAPLHAENQAEDAGRDLARMSIKVRVCRAATGGFTTIIAR